MKYRQTTNSIKWFRLWE